MKNAKISKTLIVDEDASQRELFRALIYSINQDTEIHIAKNINEAKATAKDHAHGFDICIIDLAINNLNRAVELHSILKNKSPRSAFLFISPMPIETLLQKNPEIKKIEVLFPNIFFIEKPFDTWSARNTLVKALDDQDGSQ